MFLGGALVAMLASVPVWLRLARRYGRRRLWLASLGGRAAAFGALFGCGTIFGPAVKADVIDDDEASHRGAQGGDLLRQLEPRAEERGRRGAVLQLSHFEPNAVQDAGALLGIRAIFAGLPCFFYAAAALLLARLSLEARATRPGEHNCAVASAGLP